MKIIYDAAKKEAFAQEFPTLRFSSRVWDQKTLVEKIQILIDPFAKNPACLNLLKEVLAQGQVKVEFKDPRTSDMPTDAQCETISRTISIATTPRMYVCELSYVYSLTFELCNLGNPLLKNSKLSRTINIANLEGLEKSLEEFLTQFPNSTRYANYLEELECGTQIRACAIMRSGMRAKCWTAQQLGMIDIQELSLHAMIAASKNREHSTNGLSHFENYQIDYLEQCQALYNRRASLLQHEFDRASRFGSGATQKEEELGTKLKNNVEKLKAIDKEIATLFRSAGIRYESPPILTAFTASTLAKGYTATASTSATAPATGYSASEEDAAVLASVLAASQVEVKEFSEKRKTAATPKPKISTSSIPAKGVLGNLESDLNAAVLASILSLSKEEAKHTSEQQKIVAAAKPKTFTPSLPAKGSTGLVPKYEADLARAVASSIADANQKQKLLEQDDHAFALAISQSLNFPGNKNRG